MKVFTQFINNQDPSQRGELFKKSKFKKKRKRAFFLRKTVPIKSVDAIYLQPWTTYFKSQLINMVESERERENV